MEILVVLAILSVLTGVVLSSFYGFSKVKNLEGSALVAVSTFDQARSLTLSAKDGSAYGVHIGDTQLVLFKGTSYSSGDPDNVVVDIHASVGIQNINLTQGGDDVVFQRLSGATLNPGTFELYLIADTGETRTITISGTGLTSSGL